uniref:hypothetical protein n=1 Tax=Cupriavidus yeoncheonensis TaxID=1462994 RepID=UPI003F498ECB
MFVTRPRTGTTAIDVTKEHHAEFPSMEALIIHLAKLEHDYLTLALLGNPSPSWHTASDI